MWKNPFRKVPATAAAPAAPASTLKERVAAFWNWYSQMAADYYATIEDKRCADLEKEVSCKVDDWLPGFGWVFGAGENGRGHSFTLTPEGDPHKRLAAHYWLSQAPEIAGWTFYAARQPSRPFKPGQSINIDGLKFRAEEIWLTPWVDDQEERLDITVWHPLFDRIPERLRNTVTFLWLDEVLGEEGTSNWIGEIKLGDQLLADAMPLSELPGFIVELQARHGWEKYPPHETFTGYQQMEPGRGRLRGDIIAGSTCQMSLVHHYPMEENPLAELGADYVMITLPAHHFPQGRQVEVRGEMEDSINAVLKQKASGQVLGGASGLDYFYIDLILFDGDRSRRLVQDILEQQGLAGVARLHPFVVMGG